MPPKIKITKEMILDASFEIIRSKGHEHLNVRNIAEYLKCSTQPVLYNFKTVDEIREAVYRKADEYHTAYIMPEDGDENPMLSLGLNYVRFGQEEKNLFRFLFQTNQFGGMDIATLMENPDLSDIILVISKGLDCDATEAGEMFLTFFTIAHGLASLLANNAMKYDGEQSKKMLSNVFFGMLASRQL
ncbi:MAG: TetR/AcrR family transcriptional regulator [Lachnospiraceae bacterium]|nr:TetR/AcrR family transcriptional regulator [Lachnospiraceae bacterium]